MYVLICILLARARSYYNILQFVQIGNLDILNYFVQVKEIVFGLK
jgi:hypothetical protein